MRMHACVHVCVCVLATVWAHSGVNHFMPFYVGSVGEIFAAAGHRAFVRLLARVNAHVSFERGFLCESLRTRCICACEWFLAAVLLEVTFERESRLERVAAVGEAADVHDAAAGRVNFGLQRRADQGSDGRRRDERRGRGDGRCSGEGGGRSGCGCG